MASIDDVTRAAELLPDDDRKTVKIVLGLGLSVGDKVMIKGLLHDYVVTEVCDDHMTIDLATLCETPAKQIKPTANRPYYQRGRW